MIVEPDFLEHWKTQMLIQTLNDPCAPLYLIRLWAHCQQRRNHEFCGADRSVLARMLAAIVRFPITTPDDPDRLLQAMIDCRFVDVESRGETVVGWPHNWDIANAKLVANWTNGGRGGRPKKHNPRKTHNKPKKNPTETHAKPKSELGEPIREEKRRGDRIGEEEEYPTLLAILEEDPTFENAVACIYACHPDFSGVSYFEIENALKKQPEKNRWSEAIAGMASKFAGVDMNYPVLHLKNWLAGTPDEKKCADSPTKPQRLRV